MNECHVETIRDVLSCPTAPFVEQAVAAMVKRWAGALSLPVTADAAGNLYLNPPPRGAKGPRWYFTAHMDHPGFVACRQAGRNVWAEFRGGVEEKYFAGSAAVFFTPDGPARATVESYRKTNKHPWPLCRLRLRSPQAVPAGSGGMWDLPACRVRGKRLASRACDDLAGLAAVLCALAETLSERPDAPVTGLLTRAEEVGFVGALAACDSGCLGRDARIISIETSAQRPGARLGDGVVIRVGDRARTFHPSLTAHVAAVSQDLAKLDPDFRSTRQLMPGGTCESTAFCMWGHVAAALCVPLANYHNMDGRGRIAAEAIDLDDFENLVKLLAAIATDGRDIADTDSHLRARLQGLLDSHRKYL